MTAVTHQNTGRVDGFKFLNIAGAATTVVKAGPGFLKRIQINKKIANGVITIYDNASAASGTKVGTITNPATLLDNADEMEYDVNMANGIVVVTSAADDITVVFD